MTNGPEKVIFDTNAINCDQSPDRFLGNRAELERFAPVAEMLIPEIVIGELKIRKKRHLLKERSSFLENIFHALRGINKAETKAFDINAHIAKQEAEETIPYKVIALTDFSVLPKMQKMALANRPPFEKNNDKGFKDAYIYFTILEYLETIPGENVFLVTNDERLKQSFDAHVRVRVILDLVDFQRYRTSAFREQYFLETLGAELGETIQDQHVKSAWLNINSNWVLSVETGSANYRIEVDFNTREILGFTNNDLSRSEEH